MITDRVVSPESSYGQAEDLTEQATTDHGYELDEGWLEEQLLDSPDAEVQTSESPAEAPASSGTSHLPLSSSCDLLCSVLTPLFCFAAKPSAPASSPEAADVPASTSVSPIPATRRQVRSPLYLLLL
jgi:hypothetical protein